MLWMYVRTYVCQMYIHTLYRYVCMSYVRMYVVSMYLCYLCYLCMYLCIYVMYVWYVSTTLPLKLHSRLMYTHWTMANQPHGLETHDTPHPSPLTSILSKLNCGSTWWARIVTSMTISCGKFYRSILYTGYGHACNTY